MNTTVKNLFNQFCKVYNLRTREDVTRREDNPGQKDYYSHEFLILDYAPCYGGYRIDIITTGTGQRTFDTLSRKTAKEMIAYLQGLLAAKSPYNFEGITK